MQQPFIEDQESPTFRSHRSSNNKDIMDEVEQDTTGFSPLYFLTQVDHLIILHDFSPNKVISYCSVYSLCIRFVSFVLMYFHMIDF